VTSLPELKALQWKLYNLAVGAHVLYASTRHEVSATLTLTHPKYRPLRRIIFAGDRPRRRIDVYEPSPLPLVDSPIVSIAIGEAEAVPNFANPPRYIKWREQEFRLHYCGDYACLTDSGARDLRFMWYNFSTRGTASGATRLVFEQLGDEPWVATLQHTIPHDGVTIL